MPLPTIEIQSKVASEGKHCSVAQTFSWRDGSLTCTYSPAADRFVEHYYEALNRSQRSGVHSQLPQFYVSASGKLTGAGLKPDISVNGTVVSDAAELVALFEKQGGPVLFDAQSHDAHPVNPHYVLGASDSDQQSDRGDKLSLAVQVAGTVRFGRGETAVTKAFNDAFVLVPHWEAQVRNAPKNLRRWLIVSQNTRYL
jgi:NTF2-related export protein 1/2